MTCGSILTIICHPDDKTRKKIRDDLKSVSLVGKKVNFALMDTPNIDDLLFFMSCRRIKIDLLVLDINLWDDDISAIFTKVKGLWVFLVDGPTITVENFDADHSEVITADPSQVGNFNLFLFRRAVDVIQNS